MFVPSECSSAVLKNSHAGCFGLSPVISAQFTLKMCVADSKSEKSLLKPPIFGVQSRSISLLLVPPKSSSSVLVMIRSKCVSICKRSHARQVNSGKITIS